MKLKSLLFGSAAIIAAGTGAQAADLPTAEPVEYVRICDAFGTGFYYIPGTDTCLKITGRVRIESHYVDDSGVNDDHDKFSDNQAINREFNNWTSRARGNVRLDARTQTDFGLIRAYINYQMTVGPSNFAVNYDGANPDLVEAFIEVSNDWGTYTAGHRSSFFDFWGSNTFGTRIAIDDNTTEQTLFAWTFGFGNGFSATLSVEDPASSGRRINPGVNIFDTDLDDDDDLINAAVDNYEGQEAPDLIGNIRVDQGWGSAQVMGAVRFIHDKTGADFDVLRDLDGDENVDDVLIDFPNEGEDDGDEIGFAVGAGVNFTLPFFGLGLNSQVTYADGMIAYATSDPSSSGALLGISSGDFIGPDAEDTTTQAWVGRAGITGSFTPTWAWAVDGSYTEIDTDSTFTKVRIPGGGPKTTVEIDGLDYDFWAVVGQVTWTPVSGLLFGWEVGYNHLEVDQADKGTLDLVFGESRKGDDDVEAWGAMFRVQRDF